MKEHPFTIKTLEVGRGPHSHDSQTRGRMTMNQGSEKQSIEGDATGRREMLRRSLYAGLIAASGGLMGAGCSGGGEGSGGEGGGADGGAAGEDAGGAAQLTLDLTTPQYEALQQPGGAVKISVKEESHPVIVIRTSESEATALGSRCTHQGCEVGMPKDGRISCPCHGSTFNVSGENVSGPAPSALTSYEAAVDGSTITIQGLTHQS